MEEYVVLIPVCIGVSFPDVQAAYSIGTNATSDHQKCRLLNWAPIKARRSLSSSVQRMQRLWFLKRTSNFDSSDHFASVHFKWALHQRGHWLYKFTWWQSFYLYLYVSVVCVSVLGKWSPERFLSPCSNFNYRIIPVLNAVKPESPVVTSKIHFQLSSDHLDFSRIYYWYCVL